MTPAAQPERTRTWGSVVSPAVPSHHSDVTPVSNRDNYNSTPGPWGGTFFLPIRKEGGSSSVSLLLALGPTWDPPIPELESCSSVGLSYSLPPFSPPCHAHYITPLVTSHHHYYPFPNSTPPQVPTIIVGPPLPCCVLPTPRRL